MHLHVLKWSCIYAQCCTSHKTKLECAKLHLIYQVCRVFSSVACLSFMEPIQFCFESCNVFQHYHHLPCKLCQLFGV